jgi:hypothetical protein
MLIELRKLKIIKQLSQDCACYTAELWIDGRLAFLTSNRGQGGADDYRQVGVITEAEVDTWLKANRPVRRFHGIVLPPTLEHEVAFLMDEAENIALLRRRLRTNVITIEDGQVYTYPLKQRPGATVIAAIRTKKPQIEILNETGDHGLRRAVHILSEQSSESE